MMIIDLLLQFVAGENDFVRIDNDDKISSIHVRRKLRLVLSSEYGRNLARDATKTKPSASTRYHLRSKEPGFAIYDFIRPSS